MRTGTSFNLLSLLRRSLLRTGLTVCLLAALLLQNLVLAGTPVPDWWVRQNVLDPAADADDYRAVNVGQLKYMAKKAALELRTRLGGEGPDIAAMIAAWDAPPAAGAQAGVSVQIIDR